MSDQQKQDNDLVDRLEAGSPTELPVVDPGSSAPTSPDVPSTGREANTGSSHGLGALTQEVRDGNLDDPMQITEFMFQLGLHYALPGRAEETVAAPSAASRPRGTRAWLVATAAIAVVAALVPRFLTRPSEQLLPYEVRGEWRTSDSRYSSRGFTLTDSGVKLDFGDQAPNVAFPITAVRRVTRGDTSEFEVLYRQDEGLTRFVFSYVESGIPYVQLSNPVGVNWTRAKDAAIIDRKPVPEAPPATTAGTGKLP